MTSTTPPPPLVELRAVGKSYGTIRALGGVDLSVRPGQVTCVLGDNGAGKSTLIKIVSGLHQHSEGTFLIDGEPVRLNSPRAALQHGIAAVYQDLATVPLMSVWRNFFLGSELTGPTWPASLLARRRRSLPFETDRPAGDGSGDGEDPRWPARLARRWPLRRLDIARMRTIAETELNRMGIHIPDLDQPLGSLSGGQRQSVAIARAVYFGARVLILDEPTAALGVKQSGVVLRYVAAARDQGLGVVLITHNPHHAHLVGDHFTVLRLGAVELSAPRDEVSLDQLTHHMSGGAELAALQHELAQVSGVRTEPELPGPRVPPTP